MQVPNLLYREALITKVPLGLNLAASKAKIARARVHCDAPQAEIMAIVEKRDRYSLRPQMDQEPGWFRLFIRFKDESEEFGLSVIVGDMFHNLRSALDYIVTALVDVGPGAKLTRKHQFPNF